MSSRMSNREAAVAWLVSALAGAICYAVTVPFGAEFEPQYMGESYQQMSVDPFGGLGPHPERFLTPLLAWLVGLSGERYWLFSHLLLVAWLALVHRLAIQRSQDHVWAAAVTLGVAACGASDTMRHLCGYADATTYLLLTLAIVALNRPVVFWTLLALGLLNHGMTLFLWPWFVFQRWRAGSLGWADGVLPLVGVACYWGARSVLMADAVGHALTVENYLSELAVARTLDLWALIVPGMVFAYGPFLIVLMWHLVSERALSATFGALLMLCSVCVILAFAIDIFRFVGLFTLCITFAVARELNPSRRARWTLVACVGLMMATLPWQRQLVDFLLKRHVEFAVQFAQQGDPSQTMPVIQGLIPAYWPVFVGYVAFVALLFVLAWCTRPVERDGAIVA